jgi:hypothetical protein
MIPCFSKKHAKRLSFDDGIESKKRKLQDIFKKKVIQLYIFLNFLEFSSNNFKFDFLKSMDTIGWKFKIYN